MTLKDFFGQNPKAALAFSGGVDSSYLLYAALQCGCDVTAYYVKSAFQPQFEYEDALKLAKDVGAQVRVIEVDILCHENVALNDAQRCYYCKTQILSSIFSAAKADGYDLVIDGTNASDDAGDRAGTRALNEMRVKSPLRECGLTKDSIRALSKQAGLFTWDKAAYACLATRIPTGVAITKHMLSCVEAAEDILFAKGFTDFRVRTLGDMARIQLPQEQMPRFMEKREEIVAALAPYFTQVLLDMQPR